MTATSTTTFSPPWAVTCWADDTHVYVELPAKSGPPYIQAFSLTTAGLDKALKLMRKLHKAKNPTGSATYSFPTAPVRKLGYTEAQRAATREVLRKLKIV